MIEKFFGKKSHNAKTRRPVPQLLRKLLVPQDQKVIKKVTSRNQKKVFLTKRFKVPEFVPKNLRCSSMLTKPSFGSAENQSSIEKNFAYGKEPHSAEKPERRLLSLPSTFATIKKWLRARLEPVYSCFSNLKKSGLTSMPSGS